MSIWGFVACGNNPFDFFFFSFYKCFSNRFAGSAVERGRAGTKLRPSKIFFMGELPVVVQKAYEFNVWLIEKVQRFPRNHRFGVGDRLLQAVLDLLLKLVDAAYTRDRAKILAEANGLLNRLRFLLRLAKDLKLLTIDSYAYAAECADEIGRMAGGWRKVSAEA